MNSENTEWVHATIIWVLIAVTIGLFVLTQCSCATPESLKVSHDTAGQALDYGMDLVGENESILKPLRDAKTLYGPSDLFIGPPEHPIDYDPETTQVDFLAAQANLEVRMQKMLKDFATDLAKNILPAQLSAFLPGKSDSEPFDQNGMILKIVIALAGLFGLGKGTGAVVKKIKNGKTKT